MAIATDTPVFVAGHRGLVGSAIVRALQARGCTRILTRTRQELDLLDFAAVDAFHRAERPAVAIVAAAKVGGILANDTWRYDFIHQNLVVAANCVEAARRHGVGRLLFLGSSCIYPKLCPQPMREEHLLTGSLEPTNEPYAVAKIAGLKLVESCNRQYGTDYLSAMPTNLYGPGDNFDPVSSHVLPGLIRRYHNAKVAGDAEVTNWGTGSPLREFLHVDDLASACLFLLDNYSGDAPVNVGYGSDLTIAEVSEVVARTVGFEGKTIWDPTKPDGTPRKLLDSSTIRSLGWEPKIDLDSGLASTYEWFLENAL